MQLSGSLSASHTQFIHKRDDTFDTPSRCNQPFNSWVLNETKVILSERLRKVYLELIEPNHLLVRLISWVRNVPSQRIRTLKRQQGVYEECTYST